MKAAQSTIIAFLLLVCVKVYSQENYEVCGVLETAGITFTCTVVNSDSNGVAEYFDFLLLDNYAEFQVGDTVFVRGTRDTLIIGIDCVFPRLKDNLIFPCNNCCVEGGDINGLGNSNLLDLNYLVNFIFRNGLKPPCAGNADVNKDGNSADILDLNYMVNYIFRGGEPPSPC